MATMPNIPFGVMKHFQAEVAKVVATFPQVKQHSSGGRTAKKNKPGCIWLLVEEMDLGQGVSGKPAWLAWQKLATDLKAALEPVVAGFSTVKLPGEKVPRCTYEVDVDALAEAIPILEAR